MDVTAAARGGDEWETALDIDSLSLIFSYDKPQKKAA